MILLAIPQWPEVNLHDYRAHLIQAMFKCRTQLSHRSPCINFHEPDSLLMLDMLHDAQSGLSVGDRVKIESQLVSPWWPAKDILITKADFAILAFVQVEGRLVRRQDVKLGFVEDALQAFTDHPESNQKVQGTFAILLLRYLTDQERWRDVDPKDLTKDFTGYDFTVEICRKPADKDRGERILLYWTGALTKME